MCELGLFVTIEEPAGTGGCFVTITLHDGQVVASDRIECKGEALEFCNFVICAMRLHDPAALIVVDLDPAGEADLTASQWLKPGAGSGSMYARAAITSEEMFRRRQWEQAPTDRPSRDEGRTTGG
jgi:hypothetical protein